MNKAEAWAQDVKNAIAKKPSGFERRHADKTTLRAAVTDNGLVSVWTTVFQGSMPDSRHDLHEITVEDVMALGDWARGLLADPEGQG